MFELVKKFIKKFIYIYKSDNKFTKYSVGVKKKSKIKEVYLVVKNLIPKKINKNLIRIGQQGDGGYLVPDVLNDNFFCISVGCNFEWSFEKDLFDKFGIKSLIIDTEDKKPKDLYKELFYIPKFLGVSDSINYLSLKSAIQLGKSEFSKQKKIMLKIDIEGDEYPILSNLGEGIINNFEIIIIEFHQMDLIKYVKFLKLWNVIIKKVLPEFVPVHLHPNNCCGEWVFGSLRFPHVFEITFIKRNSIQISDQLVELPHILDCKNLDSNEELNLDLIWLNKILN